MPDKKTEKPKDYKMPNTAAVNEATAPQKTQQTPKDPNFYAKMFAKMAETICRTTRSNLGM
jgi:hypothetical protein